MAMACFLLVTFLPLPLLSFPSCISCISVSTLLPAAGEYLRVDDCLAAVFFAGAFFTAFFVATVYLLQASDVDGIKAVAWSDANFAQRTMYPVYRALFSAVLAVQAQGFHLFGAFGWRAAVN
jgi:hypothetical protein